MKKLHIFLLKSFIGPFIMTFFISMFVLLMQFLFRYIDDLVGKGLDFLIIGEFLTYASLGLVPMAIPLAILLASLMTFGTLGEYYELTAMKASGISLQRIMFPLVIFTAFVTIFAFYFSNYIYPKANLKTASLIFDIKQKRPELDIKEGIFNNDIENYTLRCSRKNKQTNMMYDFLLYDHTEHKGNVSVTMADSAFMYTTADKKYLVINLYNGKNYEELKDRRNKTLNKKGLYYPSQKNNFEKERIIFDMSDFEFSRSKERLFKHSFQTKNLKELSKDIDSLTRIYDERKKSFSKGLEKSYALKYEKKNYLNDSISPNYDSINNSAPAILVNIDSIFNSYDSDKKKALLNTSLSHANSAKSYVSASGVEYETKYLRRYEIEWHRKFTLSLACLIFFFIGAPLGAIIRRGGLGLPVVISVLLFIVYYILSLSGEKFVREDILLAYQGMWISSAILLPLGIFLTYKATNDSQLFNIGAYKDFFGRLKKKFVK